MKTRHRIALLLATSLPALAADVDLAKFRRIEPQYIAALAAPGAKSGNDAQSWGIWTLDPGPRGVQLDRYPQLKSAGGVAPSGWKFDPADWWLEEHNLIMEKPVFPLTPGKYLVTGDREVSAVLTVQPKDKDGRQRWELSGGATVYDVTHLACRAARYVPAVGSNACSPANVRTTGSRVNPGAPMPVVQGCRQQDYAVLIIIGLPTAP
ncbi:MAG: hypothetical protein K2X03_26650 [Bryobacteraceae bacterium]|nr:hypothetical protein [Bryobacteraceae bacterium]